MQIHLKTLGCRLNEAELEMWAQTFQEQGHRITQHIEEAQVIIINSCAVTQDAVRKSRQLIRRIHRENPRSKLVVSGCYATLNTQEVQSLLGVDLVISNQNKTRLVAHVLNELSIENMPTMATEPSEVALFTRGRQRAFVKVQDGCRYCCTFCIVTIARGEEVSRTINDVITEINNLSAQGIHEVVLTGVHLGGYGSDTGESLVTLIQAILEKTDIPRLRLGSLEPWELTAEFFELFHNSRLMPHLHLPLQSGSNTVLKRMARRCRTHEYKAIIEKLRSTFPAFNITTDIIVGFPDESEYEWQESIDFIENCQFGHLHIFTYSPREGTKAASFPNPIHPTIKKQRSEQLHALAQSMKKTFYEKSLHQTYPVLWEGQYTLLNNGKQRVFGYTPNYLRVACDTDPHVRFENQIHPIYLTHIEEEYALGRMIS